MLSSRLALLLTLVASLPVVAPAQATSTVNAASIRLQTFEIVWQRVNDSFFDPNFNGVDWKAVRERYRPRVEALKEDAALYPILDEMLGELKVSHFAILPPEDEPKDNPSPQDDPSFGGESGMTVSVVEGRATVTELEPNGPAAAAGMKLGFLVTRIGKTDIADLIERANHRSDRPIMRAFLVRRIAGAMLGGMPGSTVEVDYVDGNGKAATANIERREAKGKPLKFGEMPTILGRVQSKRLEGGIGYVRFNIFLPQLLDEVNAAILSFKDAPGIIVDLRDNPGGMGVMAPALARMFESKQTSLGTMKLRHGELNFVVYPKPDAFAGPVVILTDEGSASTSEVMAGGMQENGRAKVIGTTTLGAVLPSQFERLPNGARLQFAVADFKTPNGVLLEGRGVTPNVVVSPTRTDYLAGRDAVLEAAIKHVKTAAQVAPVSTAK